MLYIVYPRMRLAHPDTTCGLAQEDRNLLAESDRTWLFGDVIAGETYSLLYSPRTVTLDNGATVGLPTIQN